MSNFIKVITGDFKPVIVKYYMLDEDIHRDFVETVKSRKEQGFDFAEGETTFDPFYYNGLSIEPLNKNCNSLEKRAFVVNGGEEYVFPRAGIVFCKNEASSKSFFGKGEGIPSITKINEERGDIYPFAYITKVDTFELFEHNLDASIPGEYGEMEGISSSFLLDLMVDIRKMKRDTGIYIFKFPHYESGKIDNFITLSFFVKGGIEEHPVILSYRGGFNSSGKYTIQDFRLDYFCNSNSEVSDWPKRGWTYKKFDQISVENIEGKYVDSLGEPYKNYNTVEEFCNSLQEILSLTEKNTELNLYNNGFSLLSPFYSLLRVLSPLKEDYITLSDFEKTLESVKEPYFFQLTKDLKEKVDLTKGSELHYPFISSFIANEKVLDVEKRAETGVTAYSQTCQFTGESYIPNVEINLDDVISKDCKKISKYDFSNLRNFVIKINNGNVINLNNVAEFFWNINKSQNILIDNLKSGRFRIIESRTRKEGRKEYRVRPYLEYNSRASWGPIDPRLNKVENE